MTSMICRFARDESGTAGTELALVVSLTGVSIITAVTAVGVKLTNVFVSVGRIFP